MRWRRVAASLVLVCAAGVLIAQPANAAGPLTGRYLQVVAHQDDDLLFMNPDIQNTINAHLPTATVYLTAGENHNASTDPALEQCRGGLVSDDEQWDSREHYAWCRQEGARAAWAHMAGVPNVWARGAGEFGPGVSLEIDTLSAAAAPVYLFFLNLPEDADPLTDDGSGEPGQSLRKMYLDPTEERDSIVPSNAAVGESQHYSHSAVVAVLSAIYDYFSATVIRTQDPEPDSRYRGDHYDHVYGARFAREAADAGAGDRYQLISYRDYNISDAQVDLEGDQITAKQNTFNAYRLFDEHVPGVGDSADYDTAWPAREYHRYWGGTNWVGRNADGRFQAFGVVGGKLLTWWQASGGAWNGPRDLGNGGSQLAPGVAVANNADGRLEVFCLDLNTYNTVTTYQSQVNGDWVGHWDSLGNPNAGLNNASQVGTPVAAVQQDGRIRVFEKNGGGGVSSVVQRGPNDGFQAWNDEKGEGVQDGLAAITNPQGRIEVFAHAVVNGVGRLLQYYQHLPNDHDMQLTTRTEAYEPAGPPTVAMNRDGRLDVFYRMASNTTNNGATATQVGHDWQVQVGGAWSGRAENIGGHGGIGSVAAASAPSATAGTAVLSDARIMLFEHNRGGGVSMTRQVAADSGYVTSWTDTGGFIVNEPAVMSDPFGWMFAFAVTGDGRLMVCHQTTAGGAADFTDWTVVG